MKKTHALLTDIAWPDDRIERKILASYGVSLTTAHGLTEPQLVKAVCGVGAIMVTWDTISRRVIEAATDCKIIARMGIGLDNIEVKAATAHGVVVTNVPDYCHTEVAEHSLALLLSLARRIHSFTQAAQEGRYSLKDGLPLRRLKGQQVGIIGFGRIGRTFAEKALALGFKVVTTSRSERDPDPRVPYVSLASLLKNSDYVVLLAPHTAETEKMISTKAFSQMKPTAYLINTARGALVDHPALAKALVAGELAGAALDVQTPEPPDLKQPPYNDPRVIITPHAAFYSTEAVEELRTRVAHQVGRFLTGQEPENIVNKNVIRRSFSR